MKPIEEPLRTSVAIENRAERALLNILHTGSALRTLINNSLRPYELTEPQYNVLRILRGQGDLCMNLFEIGDRMVHRDSNVSRIVDKLEAKGMAERTPDDLNRRRVEIRLTASGASALHAIQPQLDSGIESAFRGLQAEEIETLCNLLDRISA